MTQARGSKSESGPADDAVPPVPREHVPRVPERDIPELGEDELPAVRQDDIPEAPEERELPPHGSPSVPPT